MTKLFKTLLITQNNLCLIYLKKNVRFVKWRLRRGKIIPSSPEKNFARKIVRKNIKSNQCKDSHTIPVAVVVTDKRSKKFKINYLN